MSRSYRSDNIVPILAIIVLCFLVYIATIVAGMMGHDLVTLLGLRTASFLAQPWTIVTNLFVHGAIFALGGTLTVLTPRLRVYVFPIPAPIPLWAAVLGVFVIMSFVPGIAWQGHLGGLGCHLIYRPGFFP